MKTKKQLEIESRHGTLEEFEVAVHEAIGEISVKEASTAIEKYKKELLEAGKVVGIV